MKILNLAYFGPVGCAVPFLAQQLNELGFGVDGLKGLPQSDVVNRKGHINFKNGLGAGPNTD